MGQSNNRIRLRPKHDLSLFVMDYVNLHGNLFIGCRISVGAKMLLLTLI
jgi:hypothetical protein